MQKGGRRGGGLFTLRTREKKSFMSLDTHTHSLLVMTVVNHTVGPLAGQSFYANDRVIWFRRVPSAASAQHAKSAGQRGRRLMLVLNVRLIYYPPRCHHIGTPQTSETIEFFIAVEKKSKIFIEKKKYISL